METPEAYHSSPAHPELPSQFASQVSYVENTFEARTTLGARRVLARQGWVGEKRGFSTSSFGTPEHVVDERTIDIGATETDRIEERFVIRHKIPGVS